MCKNDNLFFDEEGPSLDEIITEYIYKEIAKVTNAK